MTAALGLALLPGCNRRGGQALEDNDLSAWEDQRAEDGDLAPPPDLHPGADLRTPDARPADDLSPAFDLLTPPDLTPPPTDLFMPPTDLSMPPFDLSSPDLHPPADLRPIDAGPPPDLRLPDLGVPDLRPIDAGPPADLRARPACMRGAGFAAFRFHYTPGSTSAMVDAFGLPDNTNWEAVPAFATSTVDHANGGGIHISGGNWLLIRYSVAGLTRINSATFSIRGRSYNVTASGSFEAWSPIYGSDSSPINSVSNAWPYTWTSVDYTGFVQVGDPPGLTGIRLYARGGSDDLVINTVELCIDGS